MSGDCFSDGFGGEYVRTEDSNIEISIKTLMGTTFNMKVSARDTVGDVKRKIYRIEGIPIYQQNLIHQYRELKDTNRLGDAGITNGSTLTLISAMRGGPISTRRLSVACEHHVVLKELKDILDNTREEISPGSKVSVLVFKEGDVINLLRVIENEDGSYSPYGGSSSSSSAGSAPSGAGSGVGADRVRPTASSPPPPKPVRRESRTGIFERLVEDNEMSNKICNLRKKMDELVLKKQAIGKKTLNNDPPTSDPSSSNAKQCSPTYKLLSQCNDLLDGMDLKICEKTFEEENEEEIALKDKHRSKLLKLPARTSESKTLYKDTKGVYSHTKHMYTRNHKKPRESTPFHHPDRTRTSDVSSISSMSSSSLSSSSMSSSNASNNSSSLLLPALSMPKTADITSKVADFSSRVSDLSTKIANFSTKMADFSSKMANDFSKMATKSDHHLAEDVLSPALAEQFAIFKEEEDYAKSLAMSTAGNRIHLARLVLSETADRPKSSPDSIELEENAQDIWEIHEPSTERLKHSATCSKIASSLLKRRQSLEFAYDDIDDQPSHRHHHQKTELSGNFSCNDSDYGVCSGNYYAHHMTQFVTSPAGACAGGGAEIPQKGQRLCDYYFSKPPDRSPLYGRTSTTTTSMTEEDTTKTRNLLQRVSDKKYSSGGFKNASSAFKNATGEIVGTASLSTHFLNEAASSIQRLRNDDHLLHCNELENTECDSLFSVHDESINELYGYYNLGCSALNAANATTCTSSTCANNGDNNGGSKTEGGGNGGLVEAPPASSSKKGESSNNESGSSSSSSSGKKKIDNGGTTSSSSAVTTVGCSSSSASSSKKLKIEEKPPELPPPVIKKKARCSECNRRLNITNIYDCRCGKMFCSQHRYPEVHRCTFDYKLEGKKILKQQNPLVTAEKVTKI